MLISTPIVIGAYDPANIYFLNDTIYKDKHLITSIGDARALGDGIFGMSSMTEDVVNALLRYRKSDNRRVYMVEIPTADLVGARVHRALETAKDKDAILFIVPAFRLSKNVREALNFRPPG